MAIDKIKNVFVEGPLSPTLIADSVAKHSSKKNIGAHSIFLGQVRNDTINQKKVIAIDYSTYQDMALENFYIIKEDTFSKFSIICMHIYHSVGRVKAGEISLFVFTSSAHRKEAIDACEYAVNRIKAEVAVWGKEIFEDESFVWKESNY